VPPLRSTITVKDEDLLELAAAAGPRQAAARAPFSRMIALLPWPR
jgi:hypothetical protein